MSKQIFLFLGLVLAFGQTQHITPFTGTWKLNLSKSKFDPGPPFQSFTLTFSPDGTRHLDLVGADGKPFKASLPWSDGREVAVAGAQPNMTARSMIRSNAVDDVWKRDGALIEKVHGVVSADGKTLTMNVEGPNGEGGTYHNRVVFDRQ